MKVVGESVSLRRMERLQAQSDVLVDPAARSDVQTPSVRRARARRSFDRS